MSITAIILTLNEEIHIERCIHSLKGVCSDILVVDSMSTDRTCELAEAAGARVVQHEFVNHGLQFNWALENCNIQSEWIWRVDADEYIDETLGNEVKKTIELCPQDVNGLYVRRAVVFMGKKLRFGGWRPHYYLKIIRRGHGKSETRWMDEHLHVTDGNFIKIRKGFQTDENLNSLHWWINKHNNYSNNEAIETLFLKYGKDIDRGGVKPKLFGTQEQKKRWMKKLYVHLPMFLRATLYFFYRYFILLGLLDGKAGMIWHGIQGWWYRTLVDAKIYEIKKQCDFDKEKIKDFIKSQI